MLSVLYAICLLYAIFKNVLVMDLEGQHEFRRDLCRDQYRARFSPRGEEIYVSESRASSNLCVSAGRISVLPHSLLNETSSRHYLARQGLGYVVVKATLGGFCSLPSPVHRCGKVTPSQFRGDNCKVCPDAPAQGKFNIFWLQITRSPIS